LLYTDNIVYFVIWLYRKATRCRRLIKWGRISVLQSRENKTEDKETPALANKKGQKRPKVSKKLSIKLVKPMQNNLRQFENKILTELLKSPKNYNDVNFNLIYSDIKRLQEGFSLGEKTSASPARHLINLKGEARKLLADAILNNLKRLLEDSSIIGEVRNMQQNVVIDGKRIYGLNLSREHKNYIFNITSTNCPITKKIMPRLMSTCQQGLLVEQNLMKEASQKTREEARVAVKYVVDRVLVLLNKFAQFIELFNSKSKKEKKFGFLSVKIFAVSAQLILEMHRVIDLYSQFQDIFSNGCPLIDDLTKSIEEQKEKLSGLKTELYNIYQVTQEADGKIVVLHNVKPPKINKAGLYYSDSQDDPLVDIGPSIAEIQQRQTEQEFVLTKKIGVANIAEVEKRVQAEKVAADLERIRTTKGEIAADLEEILVILRRTKKEEAAEEQFIIAEAKENISEFQELIQAKEEVVEKRLSELRERAREGREVVEIKKWIQEELETAETLKVAEEEANVAATKKDWEEVNQVERRIEEIKKYLRTKEESMRAAVKEWIKGTKGEEAAEDQFVIRIEVEEMIRAAKDNEVIGQEKRTLKLIKEWTERLEEKIQVLADAAPAESIPAAEESYEAREEKVKITAEKEGIQAAAEEEAPAESHKIRKEEKPYKLRKEKGIEAAVAESISAAEDNKVIGQEKKMPKAVIERLEEEREVLVDAAPVESIPAAEESHEIREEEGIQVAVEDNKVIGKKEQTLKAIKGASSGSLAANDESSITKLLKLIRAKNDIFLKSAVLVAIFYGWYYWSFSSKGIAAY